MLSKLLQEEADLRFKIDILDDFVHYNKAYDNLTIKEQILIGEQLSAMRHYHSILIKRLKLYNAHVAQ